MPKSERSEKASAERNRLRVVACVWRSFIHRAERWNSASAMDTYPRPNSLLVLYEMNEGSSHYGVGIITRGASKRVRGSTSRRNDYN